MKTNIKVDFIGVGAEKAGTTWVANVLSKHPEVCVSTPKEIFYFNKYNSYIYPTKVNERYNFSMKWYSTNYKLCNQKLVKGEFCTAYLYDKYAPKKIFENFPDVKLIICIRQPVDRMYSQYWWHVNYNQREKREFETVIKDEPELIGKSMYYKQISNFLKYFSKDQILIINIDDIINRPMQVANRIYKFLDIKFVKYNRYGIRKNSSKKIRFKKAHAFFVKVLFLLHKIGVYTIVDKILQVVGFKSILLNIFYKKIRYPQISKTLKVKLTKNFLSDISKLEKNFDLDLSSWKCKT